jgi:hypothetical protein
MAAYPTISSSLLLLHNERLGRKALAMRLWGTNETYMSPEEIGIANLYGNLSYVE